MNDKLTFQEMQDLIKANLYTFDGETATPNYRYCKRDAPVYRWQDDREFPFVRVTNVTRFV